MSKSFYKILLFIKRRPGMTLEAFEDYYENHHVPLALKYSSGLSRYIRRYVTPHPNPDTGEAGELAFDAITELWFEDEAIFKATVHYLSTSVLPDEVVDDERRVFDRPKLRMATVVERETALPKSADART